MRDWEYYEKRLKEIVVNTYVTAFPSDYLKGAEALFNILVEGGWNPEGATDSKERVRTLLLESMKALNLGTGERSWIEQADDGKVRRDLFTLEGELYFAFETISEKLRDFQEALTRMTSDRDHYQRCYYAASDAIRKHECKTLVEGLAWTCFDQSRPDDMTAILYTENLNPESPLGIGWYCTEDAKDWPGTWYWVKSKQPRLEKGESND